MKRDKIGKANTNIEISCNRHIESINKRMGAIPGIAIDNFGLSAHLGRKFSPGCNACKRNKWVVAFVGYACNRNCYFCPQSHNKPACGGKDDNEITDTNDGRKHYSSHLLLKLKNAAASKSIEAIGYGGGEPLLYLDKVKYFAKVLTGINSGVYQYVYTNGIEVTKDCVKELRDVGIKEVRFNLAATNYSKEVIKKMGYVKRIIPFLTIEVPALKNTCKKLRENIQQFIDSGVDQINLSELIITQYNEQYFKNEKCYRIFPITINDIKEGKISSSQLVNKFPVFSRHVTYDVMEVAAQEGWPITINDCSHLNHVKLPQSVF